MSETGMWELISQLELPRMAKGFNIRNTAVLKRIHDWLEETPEDSWAVWHMGNI
jgi:hypothetical protein